ncbi:Ubiquitin carboxyl-terminal hydrolase 10 [Saguinus oedipus]|uniref:Ubiquitin carboxyl-terminal hydrolase 10 n=1 Tax=Saguinus oedipus TaxID=9490 RepID=A0ABQ9TD23_SAGOE|nr:Ubiquitin carboxyl-terminal hydrolase 10 [Saguinus oedipus]
MCGREDGGSGGSSVSSWRNADPIEMCRHDFSPDELNQFFVTPQSSVELPPYSGTVLCGTQAVDQLPDGQEYQRIEFGVNEVIEPSDTLPRTPNYSISSTLNPQAPEFILGCTPSKMTPDGITKEASYGSIDCQYPGSALALDGDTNVEVEILENDGVSGGLGQRECKKKKKWPPGYYSYLKDGGNDGISTEALVNGHASSAVPNSVSTEDAEFMGDMLPSVMPRTLTLCLTVLSPEHLAVTPGLQGSWGGAPGADFWSLMLPCRGWQRHPVKESWGSDLHWY